MVWPPLEWKTAEVEAGEATNKEHTETAEVKAGEATIEEHTETVFPEGINIADLEYEEFEYRGHYGEPICNETRGMSNASNKINGNQGSIEFCEEYCALTYRDTLEKLKQVQKDDNLSYYCMTKSPFSRQASSSSQDSQAESQAESQAKSQDIIYFISLDMWKKIQSKDLKGVQPIFTQTITKTCKTIDTFVREMQVYDRLFYVATSSLTRATAVNRPARKIQLECMSFDLGTQIHIGEPINHWKLANCMLNGCRMLNALGFTHRDIKPPNVLYHRESLVYKLTDFGVSESINLDYRRQAGTFTFMLPSRTELQTGIKWGYANDMYAIAVTLWCAIQRKVSPFSKTPESFEDLNADEHTKNIVRFLNDIVSHDYTDEMHFLKHFINEKVLPCIKEFVVAPIKQGTFKVTEKISREHK